MPKTLITSNLRIGAVVHLARLQNGVGLLHSAVSHSRPDHALASAKPQQDYPKRIHWFEFWSHGGRLQVMAKWMVNHMGGYCSLNILVLQDNELPYRMSELGGSKNDDLDQASSGSIHRCTPRHKIIPKHVTCESTSAKVRLTKHRSISPATTPRHNVFGEETSVLMIDSVTATSQPST